MLSRKSRFSWAVLAAAMILGGCAKQDPKALIVVKGAKDVHYSVVGGSRQIRYEVNQPYPADAALKEISDRLDALGYKPLRDDVLNPGLPSSHVRGWVFFVDGTTKPEEDVQRWIAQWQNSKGSVIEYSLEYRSVSGGPTNRDKLLVYGIPIR